ncbi:MAG: hypothetical protein ACLURP_00500 [Ruminococcus sp.]
MKMRTETKSSQQKVRVSVNISYKKAQKLSNETTEDSVQVLHLDENLDQLEDVTDNVELNKKGKIKEVTLTTDSFSTFIIADQGLSSFKLRLQFVDSQETLQQVRMVHTMRRLKKMDYISLKK